MANRRDFLKTSAVGLAAASAPAFAAKNTDDVNVLLIITDQQHADSISAVGCPYSNTPAMDSLARRSVSFAASYSTNPVCSPARSSIVTGRMTTETGVYVNGRPIRDGIPNIGEWFSEKTNHETIYAGKWHIPRTHQTAIEGFRVLHTGIGGQGNLGDAGTSRACEAFLRNRDAKKPFLMIASFMQPHDICEWLRINTFVPDGLRYPEIEGDLPPLPDNFEYDQREPEYLKANRDKRDPAKGGWTKAQWRYYRWSYFRHIEMVDAEIGRVLRAIDECGYADNTLVIFTSDHGEGMGHHQNVRKSIPYDEACRVPFLISLPKRIPGDRVDKETLVSGVDIVPTICDYVGIEAPPNMRGVSLRAALEGKDNNPRECVFAEMPSNRARMVRSRRFKYVSYYEDDTDMLFDMKADPGETKNLATDPKYVKELARHKQMLVEWEKNIDVAPKVPNQDAWWRKA